MTTKPRIVIDARMAGAEGHGIGLYVQQLAEGLAKLGELAYEPFFLIPPDAPRNSPLRAHAHAICAIPFLAKSEILKLGPVIRRFAPALYHTPSFSSLLRYPCPYVQTVHDLNHLHFGSKPQKAYYRLVLLRSCEKARAVLSVSEAAALEVRAWLVKHGRDVPVGVAPNAILPFPEADDGAVLRRFGLEPGNFFFALTNPKPHKNTALLERAYSAAARARSLPPLAISIPGSGARGVLRTGALGANEVGALLRNAKAFYFPSLYEGFGRPPVEAALAGTIPVASSLSVHREALAGVPEAVFLDPASEPQWTESFLRMANVSDRVSESSKRWIRETWSMERLAKKMDEVYRAALER